GAYLIFGLTLKKAFLQSAPWAAVAFLFAVMAWVRRIRMAASVRRQVRLISFVIAAVLGVFAFAGPARHDGLAFNERYLLELVPLSAVAFSWALEGSRLRSRPAVVGAAITAVVVLLILLATPTVGGPDVPLWASRQYALLKLPVALGGLL